MSASEDGYVNVPADVLARIETLELELRSLRKRARLAARRPPIDGIGGVIQTMREEQGVGLRDLAARSKLSAGLISRLETDPKANPKLSTLESLARGLGCHLLAIVDRLPSAVVPLPDYEETSGTARRAIPTFADDGARAPEETV